MKTEGEWKTAIASGLRNSGEWYARRIEDQFGVGFPDMFLMKFGHAPLIVEAKKVLGRYFEPTPRQWIDLTQLHKPPHCYAILMGIDDRHNDGIVFHFSEPARKVDTLSPETFHHVSTFTGLNMYLELLERKYK
jgi:hypothetical protein